MSAQEYTVRAASGDRKQQKILLGKFPSKVPDLRTGDWNLKEEAQGGGGQRWTLEDNDQGQTFNGASEVGLAGAAPSNYFVLFRDKGDFMAVPVEKWATFRQTQQRAELSLEDAEAQMKHQRLQADKANPRLAQAIGTDAGEEASAPGEQQRPTGEDDADSDDEWKDIKARAASIAAVAGSAQAPRRARMTTGGDEDDADAGGAGGVNPEALYVPRPRDAEDWEHESEAADDDLDMGDGSEGEVEVSPARRPEVSDSDGEGDLDASKVKRTIRKMLRATGLEESDDDGSEERSEGPSGDDEDEDEDEDDLDKMASEVMRQQPPEGDVRKRKSPPPPSEVSPAGAAAAAAASGGEQAAAKKARVQGPSTTPAAGPAAVAAEFPTAAEVVELLQARGRLRLNDIVQAFKNRLKSLEERRQFSNLVKGVARLDPTPSADGQKYLILK